VLLSRATILLLCACGPSFHPDREGQHFDQIVKTATRVSRPGANECTIGTIVVDGSFESQWDSIASTAAHNGGTHYYVREKTRGIHADTVTYGSYSHTEFNRNVTTVVVVYRDRGECNLGD